MFCLICQFFYFMKTAEHFRICTAVASYAFYLFGLLNVALNIASDKGFAEESSREAHWKTSVKGVP